jgi:hypothetical protein
VRESSVTFRLDENTKQILQRLAQQEGRTLSNYIERIIAAHLTHLIKTADLEAHRSMRGSSRGEPTGPEGPGEGPSGGKGKAKKVFYR